MDGEHIMINKESNRDSDKAAAARGPIRMPAVSNSPEDPLNNPDSSRQVRDADSGRVPTAGPQVRPAREKATKRDNEANDGQNVQFGTPDLDSGDLASGTLLASNVRDDMRVRWSSISQTLICERPFSVSPSYRHS
jgi:hypothetical protein